MKKFISSLVLVSFLLAALPMSALAAPTWIDPDNQIGGEPWEHYVFWKTYYYAMNPDDPILKKGIRWNADSPIWSYTYNAMLTWNGVRPAGISAMVDEPVPSNADLRLAYTSCPGVPDAAGCYTVNSWYTAYSWNARFWKKATIYMRYGYDWTTDSLTGILRHEIGHALGFEDQYSSWWGCNSSYYGIMDTGYHNGQGYWVNCDTSTPTPTETTLWNNFHIAGLYTWYAQSLLSNGKLSIAWSDNAWNDFSTHTIYKWSASQNGTYAVFAESSHISRNGSHNDVTWPYVYYLYDEIYPYQFGVNNKWVKVCRYPLFNYLGYVGNETCSNPILYHYP